MVLLVPVLWEEPPEGWFVHHCPSFHTIVHHFIQIVSIHTFPHQTDPKKTPKSTIFGPLLGQFLTSS